jgi:hypothetical protein
VTEIVKANADVSTGLELTNSVMLLLDCKVNLNLGADLDQIMPHRC